MRSRTSDSRMVHRAGRVVHDVEAVARAAAGMVHGRVQRGEVAPARLDLRAALHGVADPAEDVLDLLDDLADEVLVAELGARTRQGDVDGLGRHEGAQGLAAQVLPAALDHALGQAAQLVGALAQHGALLRGDLAHHVHDGGDLTLAAEQRHARTLQGVGAVGTLDHPPRAGLELVKIVDQAHVSILPLTKNRPRVGRDPRTECSAVPPCLAAGCQARHAPFRPLSLGPAASLLSALPPKMRGAAPFRSLLGSERRTLALAGRLSAGDPPSLRRTRRIRPSPSSRWGQG